jgi:LAS superfamily LD-carboxypeptidase LdcB
MRDEFEGLQSPYVGETPRAGGLGSGAGADWQRRLDALVRGSPHAGWAPAGDAVAYGEAESDEPEQEDLGADGEAGCGCGHELEHEHEHDDGEGFRGYAPAGEFPYEPALEVLPDWEERECVGELQDLEDEEDEEAAVELEGEAPSAEHVAFRGRVLAAHIARSRKARGAPQPDLPGSALDTIPGTTVSTRSDTAAAAGRLLAAANMALAQARAAGDADALKTLELTATSGYRDQAYQRNLWIRYFSAEGGYYDRTRAAREALPGGPHSDAALDYMLRSKRSGGFGLTGRIAAPGYSNHQGGIAVDFFQKRKKGHRIENKTNDTARARWRRSWFHQWLRKHAEEFHFQPLSTEEWHWEYRPSTAAATAGEMDFETPRPGAGAAGAIKDLLGGRVGTFAAKAWPTTVAMFVPPAALGQAEVDVLVYAHGLFRPCGGPASALGIVTATPFKLAQVMAASNRPVVLVVPELKWESQPREHPLARPVRMNGLVAEALAQAGVMQGKAAPSLRRLLIAGHSRAYGVLGPLARVYADPQMEQGALARLAEVWALDTTYTYCGTHDVPGTLAWLDAKPGLKIVVAYRPGSPTDKLGRELGKLRHPRLETLQARESHCAVPAKQLPGLLARTGNSPGGPQPEAPDDLVPEDWMADAAADEWEEEESADEWTAEEEPSGGWTAHEGAADGWNRDEVDAAGEDFEEPQYEADFGAIDDESIAAYDQEFGTADDEAWSAQEEAPAGAASLRSAIVQIALREWEQWNRGKLKETEAEAKPLLQRYWGAVLKPGQIDGFINKSRAWSAAFISWVMKEAGAGAAFSPSTFHTGYIAAAKRGRGNAAKVQAYRVHEAAVEVGDLVCKDRPPRLGAPCAGTTYDNLDEPLPEGGLRISHGDIVLEVDQVGHRARVIGGNVGNSVKTAWIRLTDDNKLPAQPASGCAYIALLKPPGGAAVVVAAGPDSGTASAEQVRFAQRVLSLTGVAKLDDDGDLGPRTQAALAKFRAHAGLGPDGVLDAATQLALAQHALEALARQSIFPQAGRLDERTRQALAAFRAARGLGIDGRLDAGTRQALTDALQRQAGGGVTRPIAPSSPATQSAGPGSTGTGRLPPLGAGLKPPADENAYRRFRLTTYHVVDQRDAPTGTVRVPIYDVQGRRITEGSPAFFGQLSLEGTARLTDGRLVNVTGQTVDVPHDEYAPVLAYHRQAYAGADRKRQAQGRTPTSTQYSGIVVQGGRVLKAFAFHVVDPARRGVGYGMARGLPYTPFRTLAADIGHSKYDKVEQRWKGKGGLVPPGTQVYIKEYDGLRLPDGTRHDGWFIVNDTGGAIFGAHFDVFTGTKQMGQGLKLPTEGRVWFPGIEERIPVGYTYGLSK